MRYAFLAAAVLVAGVLVWFVWQDEPERAVRTEDERRESLGEAEKRAYWEDRARAETPTPTPPGDPSRKTLAEVPAKPVRVHVLFEDGQPAAGAEVELHSLHMALFGRPPRHRATTDGNGVATFTVPFGEFWLCARRGSLSSAPVKTPALRGGETFELLLGDSVVISGVVLMPDGTPRGGATVSLNYWDGWQYRFVEGRTLPDGTFRTPPLPRRWIQKMHVYVFNTGLPRALFQYDRIATDLRLRLSAERVAGLVIDENRRPLPGVQIWSRAGTLKTDAKGRFELWFQRRAGQHIVVGTMEIALREDDETLEIVRRNGVPIHGRLLTHERKPRQGTILLWSQSKICLNSAHVRKDGTFTLSKMDRGPYSLTISELQQDHELPVAKFLVDDVRPGQRVEVVLPKPILVTLRMRREDGREPQDVRDSTLIVRRGNPPELLKNNLGSARTELRFVVWHEDDYRIILTTAHHEPVRFGPVRITHANKTFDIPLKKRPHRR